MAIYPKSNSREDILQRARLKLSVAVCNVADDYNLTSTEITSILAELTNREAGYALRVQQASEETEG